MRRHFENKEYRVYVDHGEAYGNMGDEAMLISALDRINSYLGNCRFIIPIQDEMPLPAMPSNVQFVTTPRLIFRKTGRLVGTIFRLIRCLPYVNRLIPSENDKLNILIWKNVDKILAMILPLLLRLPNKLSKTINMLKTCDLFYGVGAADINDFNLEDVVYKSWLYKTARPRVKVSVVSSQGIGPLNNQWAIRKIKEAFEYIDFLSFRDCFFSKSIVDELQPQNVKYSIVGDEAFNLSVGKEGQVMSLLKESGIPDGASFIAFHFRETDYTKSTSFLIPKISILLDRICETFPHFIVFVPLSYHIHSKFDIDCGIAIKSLMKKPSRFLVQPLCRDVRVIKGLVGQAVFSLGLSYHLHVFALSQNRPSIILYTGEYYRYKSNGLIGFYGEPCRAFNLEQTNIEDVLEAIKNLEEHYEYAIKKIASVNKQILDMNDWHLREMKSALTSRQAENDSQQ